MSAKSTFRLQTTWEERAGCANRRFTLQDTSYPLSWQLSIVSGISSRRQKCPRRDGGANLRPLGTRRGEEIAFEVLGSEAKRDKLVRAGAVAFLAVEGESRTFYSRSFVHTGTSRFSIPTKLSWRQASRVLRASPSGTDPLDLGLHQVLGPPRGLDPKVRVLCIRRGSSWRATAKRNMPTREGNGVYVFHRTRGPGVEMPQAFSVVDYWHGGQQEGVKLCAPVLHASRLLFVRRPPAHAAGVSRQRLSVP